MMRNAPHSRVVSQTEHAESEAVETIARRERDLLDFLIEKALQKCIQESRQDRSRSTPGTLQTDSVKPASRIKSDDAAST